MKVYLVLQTPHGHFWKINGVYISRHGAEQKIKEVDDTSLAWKPYIIELELRA